LKAALIVANTAGTKPKHPGSTYAWQIIRVSSQKVEKLIFQAAEESTAAIAATAGAWKGAWIGRTRAVELDVVPNHGRSAAVVGTALCNPSSTAA
jgi:hypothetical protein